MSINLEMCIEHLIYALEELECSQTPFFREELKAALEKLIIFENDIDNFLTKKHNEPDLSLLYRRSSRVQKRYADFYSVNIQIEGALIELEHLEYWSGDEWLWFQDDLDEVIELLIDLHKDFAEVNRIMEFVVSYNPPPGFYDLLSSYLPVYIEVIHQLKALHFPVNREQYIADPTLKELPSPKSGSYRKGRQRFTTFATGSKAMLVLQGTGRTADRSHILNREARHKKRNK